MHRFWAGAHGLVTMLTTMSVGYLAGSLKIVPLVTLGAVSGLVVYWLSSRFVVRKPIQVIGYRTRPNRFNLNV